MVSLQRYLKRTKSSNILLKLMKRRLIEEYNRSYVVLVQWDHSVKSDLLIGYEYLLVRDSEHSEVICFLSEPEAVTTEAREGHSATQVTDYTLYITSYI
jgi:hypothetical protein